MDDFGIRIFEHFRRHLIGNLIGNDQRFPVLSYFGQHIRKDHDALLLVLAVSRLIPAQETMGFLIKVICWKDSFFLTGFKNEQP